MQTGMRFLQAISQEVCLRHPGEVWGGGGRREGRCAPEGEFGDAVETLGPHLRAGGLVSCIHGSPSRATLGDGTEAVCPRYLKLSECAEELKLKVSLSLMTAALLR